MPYSWITSHYSKKRFVFILFFSPIVAGLQVADLIAYPLTRHVLNPNAVNLAYDVVKSNIFTQDGKEIGLKIFP